MLKRPANDGVVIQPFSISDPHRALLADFDIDGSKLKPAHREWLDGVATFLRKHPIPHGTGKWTVTITGRASKTGSDSHNGWLSKQRAEAVRNYLLPKLPGVSFEVALAALGGVLTIQRGDRRERKGPLS